MGRGLFSAQLLEAILTDALVLEIYNVLGVAAEDAARLIFFEDDLIAVNEDFNKIFRGDIHGSAQFNRYYNTSQRIKLANDTC